MCSLVLAYAAPEIEGIAYCGYPLLLYRSTPSLAPTNRSNILPLSEWTPMVVAASNHSLFFIYKVLLYRERDDYYQLLPPESTTYKYIILGYTQYTDTYVYATTYTSNHLGVILNHTHIPNPPHKPNLGYTYDIDTYTSYTNATTQGQDQGQLRILPNGNQTAHIGQYHRGQARAFVGYAYALG